MNTGSDRWKHCHGCTNLGFSLRRSKEKPAAAFLSFPLRSVDPTEAGRKPTRRACKGLARTCIAGSSNNSVECTMRILRPTRLTAFISPVAIAAVAVIAGQQPSGADEGGVSFWLPGQFGSLAAGAAPPGWALANVTYLTSVSAAGQVAASRQITIGRLNPTVNVNLDATLQARIPADFVNANYVFATPVLGGQFAMGLTGAFGYPEASLAGVLTASAGGFTTTRTG